MAKVSPDPKLVPPPPTVQSDISHSPSSLSSTAPNGWLNDDPLAADETPPPPPADWAPTAPTKVALDVALLRAVQQAMERNWHWKHLSRQRFLDTCLVWTMHHLTPEPQTPLPKGARLTAVPASLDVSVLREIQRISEQNWSWNRLSLQEFLEIYLGWTIACFTPQGFRLGIRFGLEPSAENGLDPNDPSVKAMQEAARELGLEFEAEE